MVGQLVGRWTGSNSNQGFMSSCLNSRWCGMWVAAGFSEHSAADALGGCTGIHHMFWCCGAAA
jgi:hypothetical protein